VNNKEFILELSARLGLSQVEATQHASGLTKVLQKTFGQLEGLTFQNFGTFTVRKIESRKGYSPILKDYVMFPPKRVLDFHPSEALKDKTKNIKPE